MLSLAFRFEETGRGLLASRFPGAQPLRVNPEVGPLQWRSKIDAHQGDIVTFF